MKGTPAIQLVKQVRESTFNSPLGLPCRSDYNSIGSQCPSTQRGCTQGSTEGTVSGAQWRLLDSHQGLPTSSRWTPKFSEPTISPQLRQQGLCLPPLLPESGFGLSKEHNPLKNRDCAGPWKARSPGSAGTILRMIQAPMSQGGGSLEPAAHSPISLKFSAILAFIPSQGQGLMLRNQGDCHIYPQVPFAFYQHQEHLVNIYYAPGTMLSMLLELIPLTFTTAGLEIH